MALKRYSRARRLSTWLLSVDSDLVLDVALLASIRSVGGLVAASEVESAMAVASLVAVSPPSADLVAVSDVGRSAILGAVSRE